MIPVLQRSALLGACALGLTGCVSLLPTEKPVDLYRFEAASSPLPTQPRDRTVNVLLGNGGFTREAAGDRLVAVTNGGVVYVAGARWVLPAEILFREAVAETFASQSRTVRLLQRGAPGNADYILSLEVTRFEVQHPTGAARVVVSFQGLLVRASDHAVVGEETFGADVASNENRVSSFVTAYDQALSQTLPSLSQWVAKSAVNQSGSLR